MNSKEENVLLAILLAILLWFLFRPKSAQAVAGTSTQTISFPEIPGYEIPVPVELTGATIWGPTSLPPGFEIPPEEGNGTASCCCC